jgi:DsbC/DsbD-like thiol-disulfide interchange protein
MKLIIVFITLLTSLVSYSQMQQQAELNPITWKATYIDKPNQEGELIITATIETKWHIYSQRPSDAGAIPTSFTITPNSNYQTIGKVEETNAHEIFDKAFDAKVFTFENEAVFTQKIKRKSSKSFTIKITLEFMTCNDMQCLPPKLVDLMVTIPSTALKSKL